MITRNKIEKWQEAAEELAYWKIEEANLRRVIADELLEGKPTGTHHFSRLGYHIKAVKKNNTTIDKVTLNAMYEDFSGEEKESIKFTPELVVKKYKALADRSNIDHCLVVKPGMPTIEIKEEVEE